MYMSTKPAPLEHDMRCAWNPKIPARGPHTWVRVIIDDADDDYGDDDGDDDGEDGHRFLSECLGWRWQ